MVGRGAHPPPLGGRAKLPWPPDGYEKPGPKTSSTSAGNPLPRMSRGGKGGAVEAQKKPHANVAWGMKVYYNLSRRMTDQPDAIINCRPSCPMLHWHGAF